VAGGSTGDLRQRGAEQEYVGEPLEVVGAESAVEPRVRNAAIDQRCREPKAGARIGQADRRTDRRVPGVGGGEQQDRTVRLRDRETDAVREWASARLGMLGVEPGFRTH
jgi:hypothetical protein